MAKYRGSCLCGGVRYQIKGEELGFFHCHCSRCRRLTGTGHASNVRMKCDGVEWLQGAELISTYKVPEAIRFRNDFCSTCGSPLPRFIADAGFAVVPAGTLDHEPKLKPQARIFKGSAVSWSCSDSIVECEEYPPSF